MNVRIQRISAATAFLVTSFLFFTDLYLVFYDHPLDGIGILTTFILPPAGMFMGFLAYHKTHSRADGILILLNVAALLSFFAYMFLGTLIFGP